MVISDPNNEDQPDQVLVNEKILSQFDAIGKHITAMEKSSAFAAWYYAKKLCVRGIVQVTLNLQLRKVRIQTYLIWNLICTLGHD